MTPLPHHYRARVTDSVNTYAIASSDRLPNLRTSPPEEYGGPGDAWTPEHLLVASVESCFVFTFRAFARMSQIGVVQLNVDATGTVGRQEGVTRFTEIVLRPTIVVASGSDHDRVRRLVERSEKACLVAASLNTPVIIEPRIVDSEPLAPAIGAATS